MKKALITGASSGMGTEMAKLLAKKGYYVILVARRKHKLEQALSQVEQGEIYVADVTDSQQLQCMVAKYPDIDLLVNNAGFGVHGAFSDTDLDKELQMIETNICALHTLCKLYLPRMIARGNGHILNVASLAAFMSGPLMASYYATKSYVLRLSAALRRELKGTGVILSVFCPGPVDTEFNQVAGINFSVPPMHAQKAAKIAVNKTLKGKFLIVPGFTAKVTAFLAKIMPDRIMNYFSYQIQKKKL